MYNLLLALFVITLTVNESKVSGYVHDKSNNECLAGVRVISDTDTTYTDLDGRFEIHAAYDSKLEFSLISYKKADTVISSNICAKIDDNTSE
jgi:hypothetical protein